jgi:RNA-directed DNA polymerase
MKEKYSITDKINYTEEWKKLPWRKLEITLFRLQHRLYEASKENNQKQCLKLQTSILKSACSRYLAIRQITQLNTGKKTAGIDGIKSLDPKQRMLLARKLENIKNWKHQKLKRVYIPKPNGNPSGNPLGIPTLEDRAMQCLIKYALEPVYEAYASKGSWGFRPGRSTQDVQKIISLNLNSRASGWTKSILKLDIEKCFDEMDHGKILELVILPKTAKHILRQALKAGVLGERSTTIEGTLPFARSATFASSAKAKEAREGGVISPLLCNIALHGIEDLANELDKYGAQRGLRYADDMIFFLKPGEDSQYLKSKIEHFLSERGLRVNEAKTNLTLSTQGFDFLGWNFKVIKETHKCRIQPSKKNYKNLVVNVKTTLKDSRFPYETRLKKIQIIYRGWRNYHQYCDMANTNGWTLNTWVNIHIKKTTKIKKAERINWLQKIFNKHQWRVNKFINVKMDKSPYDNDWLYWAKRSDKRYTGLLTRKIRFQKWRCSSCGLPFKSEDLIELHHIDGNNKNTKLINLAAVHRTCHHKEPNHGNRKYAVGREEGFS